MGRPHKGERVLLGTRVPPDMAELVRQTAKERGYKSTNDYLMVLAANDIHFPVADPRECDRDQEALPLTG